MINYRVEIININTKDIKHKNYTACVNAFSIPVFLIPGLEVPFRGLNLNHNYDEIKKEERS